MVDIRKSYRYSKLNGKQVKKIIKKKKLVQSYLLQRSNFMINSPQNFREWQRNYNKFNSDNVSIIRSEMIDEKIEFENYLKDQQTFQKVQYTSSNNQQKMEISYSDMRTLMPHTYLNDEIINFYMKFVQYEFLDKEKQQQIHIFNTYFLIRVYKQEYPAKWTKNVDIFQKKIILIPYHCQELEHWSLYALVNLNSLFEEDSQHKPYILYMDSYNTVLPNHLKDRIKEYLLLELKNKKQNVFTESQLKYYSNLIQNIEYCQPIVSGQRNYTDCGIFLLEYAENLMINPNYLLDNLDQDILKLNWFSTQNAFCKRMLIVKIIFNLNYKKNIEYIVSNYKFQINQLSQEYEDFSQINILLYQYNNDEKPNFSETQLDAYFFFMQQKYKNHFNAEKTIN